MKKLLIGVLCLLTVAFTTFGLAGCKKNKGESSSQESQSVSVESVSESLSEKESASISQSQSEKESASESQSESVSEGCAHALTVLKKDGDYHWYVCDCGEKSGSREAHDYDEGVVTKEPTEEAEGEKLLTCKTCGATATVSLPKADHVHSLVKNSGKAATCSEDGLKDSWSCSGCKKVYLDAQATQEVVSDASLVIPAINHANEAFSHRVAPRCGVEGEDVYVCPDCDRTRTEVIEALTHNWVTVEVVEATCQEGGYTLQKCSHCKEEQKIDVTDITDCDEEYVLVEDSTCEKTGLAKYVCKNCENTREIVISKCEHEYEAVGTVAPTCLEDGYTTYKCKTCESSYKDDVVASHGGHDFIVDGENSTEATCTSSGFTVYVCSRGCEGAGYADEIEALGHDEVAPSCTQEGYCTRCDDVRVAKIAHELELVEDKAPTCTEDGYVKYGCKHCDYEETKTPEDHKATGHAEDYIQWTEEEVSLFNSSCQYYVVKSGVCPSCSQEVVRQGEVYVSHSYVCEITTPATCIAEGVKTYTCSCGDSYTENYDIDESAHKLDAGVQEGNYLVYTCLHECGHTERVLHIVEDEVNADVVKEAEKLAVGDATLKLDDETKGQLGEGSSVSLSAGTLEGEDLENAKGQLSEDQLALLGNSQIYNFEMSVDGESVTQFNGYITIRIPYDLDGQDPEDIVVWYIEGDTPTLINARYIEIDGQGYAEFETNHFSYYSVAKMTPAERCAIYGCYTEGSVTVLPATCLEGGYTLTVCRRCGKKTYTDKVPALGHDWAEVDSVHVDVSCTVNGYEKHECTRCQVYYEVKTQAHGHEWVKNDGRTVVASCTQEGSVTYECTHCDNEYSVTEKKTPHKYATSVVNATCTTAGYTDCVCRDCGHTTTKNPTPALGHSIVDTVHKPTCIERGYTSHKCSRCDEVFANTDYTDKADHEWDKDEPTCEEDKLCKHCKKRDENNGKAKGHYMENGKCKHCSKPCNHNYKYSHTVDSTCSGAGYEVWVCKHCQASEYRGETGVASHDLVLLKEVAPTCQTAGYKVEVCRACGYTQTTETTPAVDHKYVNGKCTYCGHVHEVAEGYLNVIDTLKNVNGVVIKIDELDYSLFDIIDGEREIEGIVTALKALELMLYVDGNGALQGAATGAIQIYNGPVSNGYASYAVKGLIEGEYLYVLVEVEDGNAYDLKIKLSVQATLDNIISNTVGSEDLDVLFESGLVDVALEVLDGNSELINATLSKIINVIFTAEKADGATVYTLDFDKLRELNDDLAHLSAKDALSKYFGEEFLSEAKKIARQLVFLEVNDLPEYVEEKGLPADAIFEAINFIAKSQGAPEDYDIRAMLEDPQMAGYTVGDLVFGEDFSFDEVMGMVEEMQEMPVYLILMGTAEESYVEEVYQAVDGLIGMVEGVDIWFTADANGIIEKINASVKDFEFEMDGIGLELSISLSVELNGAIDVTWSDIVGDIEEDIVLPEGLEDQIGYQDWNNDYWDGGTIEIDGKSYRYQHEVYYVYRSVYGYSEVAGAVAKDDCGDWIEYAVMVPYYKEYAYLGNLTLVDKTGEYLYFFTDGNDIDTRISVTVNEETGEMSFVGADGNLVSIISYEHTLEIYELAFGKDSVERNLWGLTSETVYYNKATGEYDGYTHHNFVLDEENSYAPSACEEQGLNYYVCTECGEVYRDFYTKRHNTVTKYALSKGSTTCDDGVDMYYECKDCGKVIDYYENWSYGCHYTYERVLEDNKAITRSTCYACGRSSETVSFTLDTEFTLELYTGTWGKPSTDKPDTGIGGSVGGNTSVEKREGFTFKFVAPETVTVEFYSSFSAQKGHWTDFYGYVYDGDFNYIQGNSGNLEYGNFGILYTFEKGETYYLTVDHNSYYAGAKYFVHFNQVEQEIIDLSEYGCACGGEVVITSAFGKKQHTVNVNCGIGEYESCPTCGFFYNVHNTYEMNESCEEVERYLAYFTNGSTGETVEYVLYENKTGNVSHSTYSEDIYEEYESVDSDGNPITVREEGWIDVCHNCGKTVDKRNYVYHYAQDGREIYHAREEYVWSTELGECVISYKDEYTYESYVYPDGRVENKVKTNKATSYDGNGNETEWTLREYVYYAGAPCKMTKKVTYSYGEGYEDTYFNHYHSEKEIPEESYEEEVELDGVTVTKSVYTYEIYCVRCYASISKYTSIYYVDENGNTVKTERYTYGQYAESQDVYGWELIEYYSRTYGVFKYSYKYFTYDTSYEQIYYEENSRGQEISYWYRTVYEYVDIENSCEVIVHNEYGNRNDYYDKEYYGKEDGYIGKEEENREMRHIALDRAYLLSDGSTSCEDGLTWYEVCYACGYRETHGGYGGYGHRTDLDDAHLDNVEVYDLSEYGQVCGSTILVVSCPCGMNKEVFLLNGDCGCDFRSESGWLYDDESKVNHWYSEYNCAVSDPACGFAYSYEYWYSTDSSCRETYNQKWVFGLNSDNPLVIECSYPTGDYLHSYESHYADTEIYNEGDCVVYYNVREKVCTKCSHVGYKYEDWFYYIDHGEYLEEVKHTNLETYYYEEGDRAVRYTYYYEYGMVYSNDGKQNAWVEKFNKTTYYNEDGSLDYWYQHTYNYDSCVHTPIRIYESSYGEYSEYRETHDSWDYDFAGYIVTPTCTQSGIDHRVCGWCGESADYDVGCFGHSYYEVWDEEMGEYHYECSRCGLINFTGYDGNVIMEDMTNVSDGVFTVGYCFYQHFDYIVAVSLVVDGQEEPIVLMVDAYDDCNSLITVSFDAVREACNSYGLVFEEVMVRVTILPTNGDYSFDYSVTMDSHQNA